MRCPTCRLYHLGPCRPQTPRNLAGGPAVTIHREPPGWQDVYDPMDDLPTHPNPTQPNRRPS